MAVWHLRDPYIVVDSGVGRVAAVFGGKVAAGAPLRVQWLLVPQHGSKTSSSPEILDAVQARFVMVQVGYRNRFNHPASPVLVRYDERQITVVDAPHCGASRWKSWQADEIAYEREVQRRYWLHRAS